VKLLKPSFVNLRVLGGCGFSSKMGEG